MARTTSIVENGHNVWASQGAVKQNGGSLKIMQCNDCGDQVVWCKSQKTGRFYLVNVRRGYLDQRFYMGHDIHKCQGRD